MNIQLSRAMRWMERAVYAAMQYSARLAHHFILAIGLIVVLIALVSWLSPAGRKAFTTQLRVLFGATAPPDFRRLLADDSNPSQMRHLFNSGVLARHAALKNWPDTRLEAPVLTSLVGWFAPQSEPEPERDTAKSRKQARIADYLARRYRVARVPVGNLVKAAFSAGQEFDLDPLLLLAVMAIESRFNPYAESVMGAQGLMQVMSKVHLNKLDYFGGPDAALDPLVNLKVGTLILKECIARGGSLTKGLRLYVGALPSSDSQYAAKVLAERKLLRDVARGLSVSIYAERKLEARTLQA